MSGADGILSTVAPDGCWAWGALRLRPAGSGADPAGDRGENRFEGSAHTVVQVNRATSVSVGGGPVLAPDGVPWLGRLLALPGDGDLQVELRHLHEPGAAALRAYLLVRVRRPAEPAARRAAADLRTVLATVPAYVAAEPVTDPVETSRALSPFPPGPDGLAEIRKRLTTQRSTRGDTGRHWLTAVTPLRYARNPWAELWTRLAGLPVAALYSVGLVPLTVGPGLRAHLADRVAELDHLAVPGPSPSGTFGGRPPDAFAGLIRPLYAEAATRLTQRAFQLRVTVAAAAPLPADLPELLARTISPHGADGLAAGPPAVAWPRPVEAAAAWASLASLTCENLPGTYLQGLPPEAVGELEARLGSLADPVEAAAAFPAPAAPFHL